MISRYKYYEKAFDEILGNHPGLINIKELKESFANGEMIYFTIPVEYQYRPDLISQRFYGTTSLQWLITYINNIGNSPEGYYSNRIIQIPTKDKVREFL